MFFFVLIENKYITVMIRRLQIFYGVKDYSIRKMYISKSAIKISLSFFLMCFIFFCVSHSIYVRFLLPSHMPKVWFRDMYRQRQTVMMRNSSIATYFSNVMIATRSINEFLLFFLFVCWNLCRCYWTYRLIDDFSASLFSVWTID